ncbi:MAG: hypothetical protein JOY78_05925 [Pseudonocardia sp.]|nr:hypothetical protein [Pseudonocardia sp.]
MTGVSGLTEGLKVLIDTYLDPTPQNMTRLVSIMTSRKPSRPRRAWPDSMSTRSGAGHPGGAGRCYQ